MSNLIIFIKKNLDMVHQVFPMTYTGVAAHHVSGVTIHRFFWHVKLDVICLNLLTPWILAYKKVHTKQTRFPCTKKRLLFWNQLNRLFFSITSKCLGDLYRKFLWWFLSLQQKIAQKTSCRKNSTFCTVHILPTYPISANLQAWALTIHNIQSGYWPFQDVCSRPDICYSFPSQKFARPLHC